MGMVMNAALKRRHRNYLVNNRTAAFRFDGGGALSSLITFTRASEATYFDSAGVLQTAASGVARSNQYQDHDPVTLEPLGLLVEEQRTNSIRNPRCEGAVAGSPGTACTNWQVTTTTGVFTRTIATPLPAAGIGIVEIRFQASGAGTAFITFEGAGVAAATNGQTWSLSSFCAMVAGTMTNISAVGHTISEYSGALAFLVNGVSNFTPDASLTRRTFTRTNTNASCASIGSGIYITFTGAGDITLRIGIPQLELGAFATSPIRPPVASPAASTRLADSAVISGAAFASIWNQSEGAVVAEYRRATSIPSGAFPRVWEVSDGTANNRMGLYSFLVGGSTNRFFHGSITLSVNDVDLVSGNANYNTALGAVGRRAFAYRLNDFASSADGLAVNTDFSAAVPAVNSLQIGSFIGTGSFLNGHIKSLSIYRSRLPNATLQALTA